jgi:hypothetical protein
MPEPADQPETSKGATYSGKELRSEIAIRASPEKVWGILTDFERFPEWNPFVRKASGMIKVGEKLTVVLQPSGSGATTFKPTVMKVEPNRELRWLGRLAVPGLFSGQHIFELHPEGDSDTRFVQREEFGGILLPFLAGRLRNETAHGFDDMNQALKRRAEEPGGLAT